jgi:hypothetical protein
MSDDEDFLITCENLWTLSEDGKALLTQVAKFGDAPDEDAIHNLVDRIDLDHVKQRLVLTHAQDLAQSVA